MPKEEDTDSGRKIKKSGNGEKSKTLSCQKWARKKKGGSRQ